MEFIGEVAAWFGDPAHWAGRDGIPVRLLEHVELSGAALLAGLLIAVPIGLVIGHTGRGALVAISIANIGRALPSVGVLGMVLPLTLRAGWGLGLVPTLIALTVLAIPPVVSNLHTGLREVDRDLVEAGRGMGMSGPQLLWRVELPIALPVALAGVRTAAVQVIATATIGAILSTGGLGRYIIDGIAAQNQPKMVAGALLVMLLALASEGLFAGLQRAARPLGLRAADARVPAASAA
jgi:osmoprotectant transport system permease protein